jgi:hypothetical protein
MALFAVRPLLLPQSYLKRARCFESYAAHALALMRRARVFVIYCFLLHSLLLLIDLQSNLQRNMYAVYYSW